MRTLVTGADGFVGKHLVRRQVAEKHEVIAFDKRKSSLGTQTIQGDVASFRFDDVLDDIDAVFHLASLLGTCELPQCSRGRTSECPWSIKSPRDHAKKTL